MKFLFMTAISTLASLTLVTWAEAAHSLPNGSLDSQTPTQSNQLQEPEPEQLEYSQSSIEPLSVQRDSELISPNQRSARLADEAQQINQRLAVGQKRSPQLRDLLNLPDGMIIRGSSRGGIGIGAEY